MERRHLLGLLGKRKTPEFVASLRKEEIYQRRGMCHSYEPPISDEELEQKRKYLKDLSS